MKELIPWFISALSLLFVILTYARSGKKEAKQDVKENDEALTGIRESLIKVNLKLDQVCNTTNEIRTDNKALAKDLQALDNRVTCVENDVKNIHSFLDALKKE